MKRHTTIEPGRRALLGLVVAGPIWRSRPMGTGSDLDSGGGAAG